jgi:TonB family protein
MSAAPPAIETQQDEAVPQLLFELPPRHRVFFKNLRDLLFPRRLPPLELRSSPAPFWPDVFVKRSLPWRRFLESGVYHMAAGALLFGLTLIPTTRPRIETKPAFDHSQVIYYRPSEFVPPLDTRSASMEAPRQADPEPTRQAIISVPREADNRSQTIVTPPNVKLKREVPLPNVVAWSDTAVKPRLEIPAAPLSPAAEIARLGPSLPNSVTAPPQDATPVRKRNMPTLVDPVAAPPKDLSASSSGLTHTLQPAPVAPPTDVSSSPSRRAGNLNIAPTEVIAPAPQLAVADQRAIAGGGHTGVGAPQVVAPPPTLNGPAAAGSASGSPGRLIALNLHPAVDAPPDPPAGNRRGTFTSSPEGHPGGAASPGATVGNMGRGSPSGGGSGTTGNGGVSTSKSTANAPAGLYMGPAAKPATVAGDPGTRMPAKDAPLVASVHPPRVTSASPIQPDNAAKLSDAERAVFGNRRFYSVTLNMPNLNSAGGSWIIRFAELKHDTTDRDPNAPKDDLSQPMATRKVDPAYPMQLMRENVHGTVIVYAVIHADGTVGSVRVLRGADERLDRFATEAVSQWKFEPATKNGAPVDVEATFQIPFRPSRLGTNF